MTRFLEVDVARGIAIILMVLYHAIFDYNFFVREVLDVNSGIMLVIGRLAAVLFLLIVGISMTLTLHLKAFGKMHFQRHFLPRATKIIGLAIGITVVTLIAFPDHTIWFGILHLIGAGIILSMPIVARKNLAGILGGIILAIGAYFYITLSSATPTLLQLIPFLPANFSTFDYFPLFPWLGVMWIGIYLGHYLYPTGKQLMQVKENILSRGLAYLGKNSLVIYLIHQPVLIGLILIGKSLI